ncbi:MAG: alkaline phosphatase family protein [Armatimonadetes bacterium]|nr:alkaline phosphatase family protein [Armatimonadota bacterium]
MNEPHLPRVLMIGIDSADHSIVQDLMDRGELPALQALREEGAFGPLQSTVPALTPPAWTTLMTGKNPGRHGVFDFVPATGEPRGTPIAARRRATTVWRALSRAGFAVGTFNLPATYPPEPLSAFQIAGFDSPAFRPDMAEPPEAFEVLRQAVGPYEMFPESFGRPEADPADIARQADMPRDATRALLSAYAVDVYMVSFQFVDWLQHLYLGRHEATSGPVLEAYRLVDRRIGEILAAWRGPQTTVMVLSDHGACAADRQVSLDRALAAWGFLTCRAAGSAAPADFERRRSRAGSLVTVWRSFKRLAPGLARLVAPLAWRLRGRLESYAGEVEVDWQRTSAAPCGQNGAIRLNLEGRDPHGIVTSEQRDELVARITSLLMGLRDPVTGEPVFAAVRTNAELYAGPHAELGPDLMAIPADSRYELVSMLAQIKGLTVLDSDPQIVRVLEPARGIHSLTGIAFVAGPAIRPGSSIAGAGLADITPTLLYLLGQPLPEDLDGRVLEAILQDGYRDTHPPTPCPPWPEPEPRQTGYESVEDEAAVDERLRALGYE